ncbi:hypothetical protein FM104_07520 [Microbacterium esteraromaticum]|uniref:DUF2993 domain-containing protein n=1 Tax=Microbacterium esteraromaticum TaxID=57043 RepID=A0A1R4JHV8_9MICO|nr:DUF2993 domain-containing protein [Microbacterium esteraromaticum]SJN31607.1 hypothetical protein FM104_07520 [Microbacterium esteraromaticum]
MTAVIEAPTRRPRKRWPWIVAIVVVVIAVLLVAAELVARAVLPSTVRSLVIEQLELPADQQLDVTASGILLPQLITGTLDELQLSSDEVTIGGITGSADVVATEVPIHGGALGSAEGTITIDQSQFASLLDAADLPISEITLQEPNVVAQGGIPLFGQEIPLGLTVTPGAQDGDLLLTPVSVTIGGKEIDLQNLVGLLGDAGSDLSGPQRVCIADRLPAGIALTGLRVEGAKIVADISADGDIAVDPKLLENGTCSR